MNIHRFVSWSAHHDADQLLASIGGNMQVTSYAAAEVVLAAVAKTKGFDALATNVEGMQASLTKG